MHQSAGFILCKFVFLPTKWLLIQVTVGGHNTPLPYTHTQYSTYSKSENHPQSRFKVFEVFKCLHQAKDFSWLPGSLPPHCKFILSTVSSSLSCKSLCARPDVRTLELSGVGDEDTKFSIFRQHLSTPDQERFGQSKPILRKKPNLTPLKLAIIASELQECRIYRNEFQCLREYLEMASVQELWELILKRWVEDYGWNLKQKETNSDAVASGKGLGSIDILVGVHGDKGLWCRLAQEKGLGRGLSEEAQDFIRFEFQINNK